ncbi:amidohydrolase family protein [Methylobrevis albus]
MRIDAHQHYWAIARGDYGWMGPAVAPIVRDFGPADLAPHLAAGGIAATVLVQAADTVAETEYMLSLADAEPSIAAVVGWVDLEAADATETLARLARHPKLRGIRPMLQDIADTFWVLRPAVLETLALLQGLGLSFDALIQPRHLPVIAALADRLPGLAIVVDHGAKPFIAKGELEPWAADIAALARRAHVCCKLSGLVTEAGDDWSAPRLASYVATLLAAFGPDRLMFGSDWPVVNLAGGYDAWLATAEALTAGLSETERAAVFGGTAARFYRIG